MKSGKLDYLLEYILLVSLITVSLLIYLPWAGPAGGSFALYRLLWMYIFPVFTLTIINYSKIIERKIYGYIFLFCWLIINLLFINLSGWSKYFFLPLYFLLLFIPLRLKKYSYSDYEAFQLYLKDILMLVILYTVLLILQGFLPYSYSLLQVLAFYLLCFWMIFIHHQRCESYAFRAARKVHTVSAAGYLFLVVIVAGVIGLFPAGRSSIAYVLGKVGTVLKIIFEYFLYLVALVVAGVLNLLQGFQRNTEIDFPEGEESVKIAEEMEYINPDMLPGGALSAIFQLLLVVLAFYLFYRVISGWGEENTGDEKGMVEERESLFEPGRLRNDFFRFLRSLKERTFGRKGPVYDQNDPVQIVRECYYRFLLSAHQVCEFHKFYTPREFFQEIKDKFNVDMEAESEGREVIDRLTELYNRARYRGKISRAEIEEARECKDKAVDLIESVVHKKGGQKS